MGHHDAVKYLSALRGSIRFDLENTIEADIDEVCDMDVRFYQLHLEEEQVKEELKPATKRLNYPGKAKDVRKNSSASSSTTNSQKSSVASPRIGELPQVHSSPTKAKLSSISN